MHRPPPAPEAATPVAASSAAALAELLVACYPQPAGTGERTPDIITVTTRLATPLAPSQSLVDGLRQQLPAGNALSPVQYGLVDVVDRVLAKLFALPAFHSQLVAAWLPYRGALAIPALGDDGWLTHHQHPVRRLLAALYALACGWQPENGSSADAARTQSAQWLAALARHASRAGELADHAALWLDEERRRVERLEKRLVDAETGTMRSRRARQMAARMLNQALAGRDIGTAAAAVLRDDWFTGLQWILLTEGEQSPLWQRAKRITGSLRWTLSPEGSEENRSQLHRLVGQTKDELDKLAAQIFSDELVRDRLTSAIESEHLCILRSQPHNTKPFEPVDAGDAVGDGSAAISETLLAAVQALEPGQWVLLREGPATVRARLLLRQDDTRQLVFSTPLGQKALVCSWEAFALRLANRDALPLRPGVPLQACVLTVINELVGQHQHAMESRQESLRLAREQAAAEARSKEEARQKALAEAKRLETARQEAQRRAADAEAAAINAARDVAQANLQRARLVASSLTMGVWVAFREADGSLQHRRLAVILASSQKYIFVEATGDGKIELTRDELVGALAAGRLTPVGKDQRLDDALSRIVDGLHGTRGNGGKT